MCANPYLGEVLLRINGENVQFKLSLGAIAFLETRMQCGSLSELILRFAENKFSAQDIINILEAGYYGANGKNIDFGKVNIEDGVPAAIEAAQRLLQLAFQGVVHEN